MAEGERNDDICDVPGILVGHDTNREAATGCTVILCDRHARGSVDVRGGAPATRETDLLDPSRMMQEVHAILLAGGSAFGLDAASGVMRVLEARGIGYEVGVARVPIVPGAALFDLGLGRFDVRPDAEAGARAAEAARGGPIAQGTVGAGTGATVGKLGGMTLAMKGGVGSASARLATGYTIGALAAVNALGDVYDEQTGHIVAGARNAGGTGWLNQLSAADALSSSNSALGSPTAPNTTLAVVATDLPLDKAALARLAQMAQDGLARAIRPIHTPFDGDVVFALSISSPDTPGYAAPGSDSFLLVAGMLAAQTLARAVVKGVRAATSLGGVPAVRDLAQTEGEAHR